MNPNVPADKELLVSVDQACARLGVSRMTLYRLIRSDELKTAKVRRRRMVSVTELNRFVARAERATS